MYELESVIGQVSGNRKTVIYCRVSSPAQRSDLDNQVSAMQAFAVSAGISVDEVIWEIGGGMNMKRPKLRSLLSRVMQHDVSVIVVGHKDRLARFGFDLIEYICELNGTRIVVANSETMSPQEEVVSDLMAIIHTFSCRLYGLRRYKDEIKNAISSQDTTKTE